MYQEDIVPDEEREQAVGQQDTAMTERQYRILYGAGVAPTSSPGYDCHKYLHHESSK